MKNVPYDMIKAVLNVDLKTINTIILLILIHFSFKAQKFELDSDIKQSTNK